MNEAMRGDTLTRSGVSSEGLVVLCYHAVEDLSAFPAVAEYGIALDGFIDHMKRLRRRGFAFCSPDTAWAFLRGERRLGRRSVLVTFDDAFRSVLPALEVLSSMGGSALVFAVSGRTGGTNEWDAARGAPRLELMTADDLRAVERNGHEIGAHSRTHPRLTDLPDDAVERETVGAIDELEALGLRRPRFFAYPHGASDERVRAALRADGRTIGFGCAPSIAQPVSDPLNLPRLEIVRRHAGLRFEWFVARTLLSHRFRATQRAEA
jgi:peptidoglycan/xylan/chitin deacetylase (PgdA/CDA1 family)